MGFLSTTTVLKTIVGLLFMDKILIATPIVKMLCFYVHLNIPPIKIVNEDYENFASKIPLLTSFCFPKTIHLKRNLNDELNEHFLTD